MVLFSENMEENWFCKKKESACCEKVMDGCSEILYLFGYDGKKKAKRRAYPIF